jgi:hypothetical protein
VRDLLGIARALYAAEKRAGAAAARLERIAEAGAAFKLALGLARRTAPDTMGHRAAWGHAERGLELLTSTLDAIAPIGPVLDAAGARVRRG